MRAATYVSCMKRHLSGRGRPKDASPTVALLVFLVAACGSDGPQSAFVLRDSAGVWALAPADAQQAPLELSLVDSAYVRIGSVEVEGPPETFFAGIVGAVLLPSGQVVLADDGNLVVRWFDASGTHVRSVGREGEGPGEFRGFNWILECPGPDLLVFDPFVGRATFLSAADGRVIRSVAVAPTLGQNRPLLCQGDGQLLVLMDRLARRFLPHERGSVVRDPAAVVRYDLSAGAVDTLQVLSGTDYYYASHGSAYSYLPLGGWAWAAVGGPRLFVGQSDGEIIRVMDLPSGAWAKFEHGLPHPPVTREAWNRAISEYVWRQPRERIRRTLREVLDETPVPERQPAFLAMRADAAGRLWLRLPGSGASTIWRIFTDAGRPVASIALPSNVEPIDIGARNLVALERGPLDVQLIRVYRLPRPLQPDQGR